MEKVVPQKVARILKILGYHEPCAHCYIWEFGEPIDKESDIPQHYEGRWSIYHYFLLTTWEWERNSSFDWMETYVKSYHEHTYEDSRDYPFVDWNMNIFEMAQERECGDFRKIDPEGWKKRLLIYKYCEWWNKATEEYERERDSISDILQWEQGNDWEFQIYPELLSAPTYTEIRDWLRDKKGIDINIIATLKDGEKIYQGFVFRNDHVISEDVDFMECLDNILEKILTDLM